MRKTSAILLIIAAMVLGSGIAVFAQSITIQATLDHGASLPSSSTILKCPGTMSTTDNPWAVCAAAGSGINFGTLSHTLTDGSQAGVFYAPNFFIVFLYPTAWGGAGYTLNQKFTWTNKLLDEDGGETSLVFTPVYVPEDSSCATCPAQGPLPSGAKVGDVGPATGTVAKLIYTSGKPGLNRIIRAMYGIPPNPAAGKAKPFDTWKPVPLIRPAGTYSGTLTLSITEL